MKNIAEETIGMRIKECRVKIGMTQEELADALYIKKTTVSAYENDKIDVKISVLKDIVHIPLERNSQSAIAGRLSAPNGKLY